MKMTLVTGAALLLAAALPLQAQPQYTGGNRPVMLKANDGLDPCSLAKVSGIGEGAVLIFPGDSVELEALDNLSEGEQFWLCDESDDGDMVGIVYSFNPETDCEVGSPVDKDTLYTGPCMTGWIKADVVEVLAG